MEAATNITPTPGMIHYVVKKPKARSTACCNAVLNESLGITTDMTRQCTLDGSTTGSSTYRFPRRSNWASSFRRLTLRYSPI